MTQTLTPKSVEETASCVERLAEPVEIVGRGTKRTLANSCAAKAELNTSALSGIHFYEPNELVISAFAGTPLSQVQAALNESNQRFAFEPPTYGSLLGNPQADPSLGGLVATNLSGPARLSRGALRDHLLGVEFVNGKGELIKSGGRVMKNVTGYDLCKLMAGSWGTLGVLTTVTLKTLPKMQTEATLLIPTQDAFEAGKLMREALKTPFDVISAAFVREQVAIRIEGLEPSVAYRFDELVSMLVTNQNHSRLDGSASASFWQDVAEVENLLPDCDRVWKVSIAPTDGPQLVTDLQEALGAQNINTYLDWAGGLLWLGERATVGEEQGQLSVLAVLDPWLQKGANGHALLVKDKNAGSANQSSIRVRTKLAAPQQALADQIKSAFDPKGLFSPNRM